MIISKSPGSVGDGRQDVDAICLGSGRFLRSVLVPFLSSNMKPAVFQTRGRNFLDFFGTNGGDDSDGVISVTSSLCYPVDTVQFDGNITTSDVEIYAAGTLGSTEGRVQLLENLVSNIRCISVIGVGVTEAGMQNADNQCMVDLTELLYRIYSKPLTCTNPNGRICVINTDNVPNNGDVIRGHVLKNAEQYDTKEVEDNVLSGFVDFVLSKVAFLNSMVDRITSSRPGSDGLIPMCEPLPMKAMVICDPERDLPLWMNDTSVQSRFGVKIRHDPADLEADISLKLRVANATHTAVAHPMALMSLVNTDALCKSSTSSEVILTYLDSLYQAQILPGAIHDDISMEETEAAWTDWRKRLQHPHFGLSTFFITQNGAAKCGIRLGPTIKGLLTASVRDTSGNTTVSDHPLSVSMAFAVAAILRFLTPASNVLGDVPGWCERASDARARGIYIGWLDTNKDPGEGSNESVTYADGLGYNLCEGWYEFRCDCLVKTHGAGQGDCAISLPNALSRFNGPQQPSSYSTVVAAYLLHPQGGNLESVLLKGGNDTFVRAVCTLYARMLSGDGIIYMLQEIMTKQHVYTDGFATPCSWLDDIGLEHDYVHHLHYRTHPIPDASSLMLAPCCKEDIYSVIMSEVRGQQVIDLHTHQLPPSHGALCVWGIDELLTYHYLVSEYFMTAPASISPEGFYALNKHDQADLIWDALFIQRSPISEATRGVITTLVALGLEAHVKSRDITAIRKFYDTFRVGGESGVSTFVEKVMSIAGVRYVIMTNIPFDAMEAHHWRPKKKDYPATFKSALRVDPLLAGDKQTVEKALKFAGYGTSIAEARKYLHDWCDTMKPEYMMASTPHDFRFVAADDGGTLTNVKKRGANEDSLRVPFAFTDLLNKDCIGCEEIDNSPSVINERSAYFTDCLMKVCEERNLPLALKIGAHRQINPAMSSAGDGMVVADTGTLARLCSAYPKVRFLATFLSRQNQHEACVLANKFRNLHIYGCWWYCNNPSIIKEITQMRLEMLGTAFTAQHSDARVIDQLIYKWSHSRAVIAKVLVEEYRKTISSGWCITRQEIRRDIAQLFGGSYEDFMAKVL